jgi:Fic family protein
MSEQTISPKKWITIRVKPDEYVAIYKLFKETINKKLSQYVRKVLLQKPFII